LVIKYHIEKSGGPTIFFFLVARLIIVLTLLGLSVFDFLQEEAQHVSPSSEVIVPSDLALILTYVRPLIHQGPIHLSFLLKS